MFTDPLMSIIDAGAKMFLEYIERVSSVKTFLKRSKSLQKIHVLNIQFVNFKGRQRCGEHQEEQGHAGGPELCQGGFYLIP